jgi:Ca-activated chloride channel family protein
MTQPFTAQPAEPSIELIPMHGAIAANQPVTMDVLVRIMPPAVEVNRHRPP